MIARRLRRVVCAIRGHDPMFFTLTAPMPDVYVSSTCLRCGRFVTVNARPVATSSSVQLRRVK